MMFYQDARHRSELKYNRCAITLIIVSHLALIWFFGIYIHLTLGNMDISGMPLFVEKLLPF